MVKNPKYQNLTGEKSVSFVQIKWIPVKPGACSVFKGHFPLQNNENQK
jgi:hypothetical protein